MCNRVWTVEFIVHGFRLEVKGVLDEGEVAGWLRPGRVSCRERWVHRRISVFDPQELRRERRFGV